MNLTIPLIVAGLAGLYLLYFFGTLRPAASNALGRRYFGLPRRERLVSVWPCAEYQGPLAAGSVITGRPRRLLVALTTHGRLAIAREEDAGYAPLVVCDPGARIIEADHLLPGPTVPVGAHKRRRATLVQLRTDEAEPYTFWCHPHGVDALRRWSGLHA
jgi:hypothetical protein